MFKRLDTVILRVRDLRAAREWYATHLSLTPIFDDTAQGLVVLGLDGTTSLTLWALGAGESVAPSSTYPIFGVDDAHVAHAALVAGGVGVGPLVNGEGVRYFRFHDLDGNLLEACEVIADERGAEGT